MNFMNQHQVLLKSFNPALIFNADETGIENKRMLLKLVTMYNNNPHIPLNRNELHITATGAFNSIGKAFPLFITLPAVKNLPQDCSDLIHEATFSSTCNGWQTSGSFYAFAVHFCHHLSIYRLTLPNNISMSPALLILDGHSSRLNKSALLYLIQHNVQILILPSHTTHLLQPFDVIVAHSLKSKYRKIFNSYLIRIINEMPTLSRTGQLRRAMCQAFIDAWNSLPGETFRNAFKVSCLVPFDLQRLSNSTFLSDVEYAPPHNTILNQISGSHLTHPVTFAAVLGESPLMFPTLPNGVSPLIPNSYFVGDSLIIATLKSLDLSTGRLLSEPPKEHYLASFNGVLIWARQF
ncbi:DDE superfamily endonuclease containing protein [Tritrichomonas foetus]|nr:DDE superfamily endonuclease containing protein [Tritrichomonas foetus]OHT08250.1 DDE superfamily endonuclease containing protein [Tritrichomonas foetus]|eukprot:OHT01014.1 DDE superfamily endonuclease containing protein [Tritrichomonas foetus]